MRELRVLQDSFAHADHTVRGGQGQDRVAELPGMLVLMPCHAPGLQYWCLLSLIHRIDFCEVIPIQDAQANILAAAHSAP